jgi:Icc-related predicted phosphoesterase
MKIVAISDTHEQHSQVIVPDGDVLVHAGDFTNLGKIPAIADFADWMKAQPHQHKVMVAGNHDWAFANNDWAIARLLLKEAGIIYLEDGATAIDGLVFWGSPWQPRFYDWAFNLDRNGAEIAAKWDLIPEETNVLITHCPPYGILDDTIRAGSQGCEMLEKRLHYLSNLKLMIYGHLHKDGGRTIKLGDVIFANAAICDDSYKPSRSPIIIDL